MDKENKTKINPGDLLAYLDGEDLPEVEKTLARSPALRRELAALYQADSFFSRAFAGLGRPDPQDMVDVVAGQSTPAQELRAAAFLRQSAAGREEMADLQAELEALKGAKKLPRKALPRFMARPLATMGVRGDNIGKEQVFYTAELQAQITLRIAPPIREEWQIEGFVTKSYIPAPDAEVTLRPAQDTGRQQLQTRRTDDDGFFAFQNLKAETYRLDVYFDEEGVVFIPNIALSND